MAYYEMDWNVIFGKVDETDIHERWRFFEVCDYEALVPNRVPLD